MNISIVKELYLDNLITANLQFLNKKLIYCNTSIINIRNNITNFMTNINIIIIVTYLSNQYRLLLRGCYSNKSLYQIIKQIFNAEITYYIYRCFDPWCEFSVYNVIDGMIQIFINKCRYTDE